VKPVLFVTGEVPAYRAGALERLHEREEIELALFGGSARHGGEALSGPLAVPHRRLRPSRLERLAASGRYRAVVCSTSGRVAPLAAWAGARRGRVPLILWASLWAHPRSVAHAFTYLPLRWLYRSADAVVTYGEHVSSYVLARGARNVHVAAQAVDNGFWGEPVSAPDAARWPAEAQTRFLFVGRPAPEKGLAVLAEAWRRAALAPGAALLAVIADGRHPRGGRRGVLRAPVGPGVAVTGAVAAAALRSIYTAADVLVAPSIATRTFREPWGLVINEAMNQRVSVIASDAVGAAAGGLVRDGENGLVVPAGDVDALAGALRRLAGDPALRARLGETGARDVQAYDYDAWAEGFSRALHSVGAARGRW
jgi:glycosyltransferase involved in cell wall biosynthesis